MILSRPGHRWPLIVGANRDEMADRPWVPPGRHWPNRDQVVAGQDLEAGGSWLGINDFGVIAGIMNRRGSLGPEADKRSRGELVLEALDHADAAVAARALGAIDPGAYRPFNLFIGDNRDAFWLRNSTDDAPSGITIHEIPPGVSMITAVDRNDVASSRIRSYLPRFEAAPAPEPDHGDWSAWQGLLASREFDADAGPRDALCIVTDGTYGTLSSSLIAVPATGAGATAKYLFCPRSPDPGGYQEVEL
ncbi:MAG: NRDE family protein [Alphaproteobacteria bacterium]